MKHLTHLLPLLASSVLLFGCGMLGAQEDVPPADTAETSSESVDTTDTGADTSDTTDTSKNEPEDLVEYYKLHYPDHRYEFVGEGNEFASYWMYPQYVTDTHIQFAMNNGGTQTVRVYEYTENEIREVFVRNETYFRENFLERLDQLESEQPEEIILQGPLEVGHSWESPSGSVSEITDLRAPVDIPFGSFEAVEVTTTRDDTTTRQYFVHEIGLIKSEFENADGSIVTSELERTIEEPETQTIQVYYPDDQALGLDTSQMELTFQTNDVTREVLASALKDIPDYAGDGLIGPNVTINYLYLNEDGRVYVDFSRDLVEEMNAGSGTEMLILQAIVNTIGEYYGVEEVVLTVEGNPYESGHILMEEGQAFQVDHSQVNE